MAPLVWPPLVLGLLALVGPQRRSVFWTGLWCGLCLATFGVGVAAYGSPSFAAAMQLDDFAQRAALGIGVWAVAWGWTFLRRDRATGWGSLTLAGLWLAASSTDLIGLAFGIEIVRLATTRPNHAASALDRLSFWGLSLAAAGCLGVTGSLDLTTIRDVLTSAYAPAEPLTPIGRPALVLVGSVALWMIAAVTPMGVRAVAAAWATDEEPFEHQLAAVTARQLAGLLALSRVIATGWPALDATLATLLVILSLVAGGIAVWLLRDAPRLDRLLMAFACWQCGGQLLGLLATALDDNRAVVAWRSLTLSHDLLMLAGMAAVAVGWVARSTPVAYLDELRGLGTIRPVAAALLLIPLASLLGGPFLVGGWLRLMLAVELFGLHRLSADDLWLPRLDARYALLVWAFVWIACARRAVEIARVTLLETPLREDRQPSGKWASAVAGFTAILAIAAGCVPQVLVWITPGSAR